MEFLVFSERYYNCTDCPLLGEGGESRVFTIIHKDLDEIVAKCPLVDPNLADNCSVFDTIFYETQLAKINCNPDYVTEIKEEIIEFNPEKMVITRYVVIIERAENTLSDLKKIWLSPRLSD